MWRITSVGLIATLIAVPGAVQGQVRDSVSPSPTTGPAVTPQPGITIQIIVPPTAQGASPPTPTIIPPAGLSLPPSALSNVLRNALRGSEAVPCVAGGSNDGDGDGHDAIECGGLDCNDADRAVFPGATEVCDAKDDDCSPYTFGTTDEDQDGFISDQCTNLGATVVAADAPELFEDRRPVSGTDCDDGRPGVHPISPEVCDSQDNDCDGSVDEGVMASVWPDLDRDGHGGVASTPTFVCAQNMAFYSFYNDDCDDENATINPRVVELDGDGKDNDCDGRTDEDQ